MPNVRLSGVFTMPPRSCYHSARTRRRTQGVRRREPAESSAWPLCPCASTGRTDRRGRHCCSRPRRCPPPRHPRRGSPRCAEGASATRGPSCAAPCPGARYQAPRLATCGWNGSPLRLRCCAARSSLTRALAPPFRLSACLAPHVIGDVKLRTVQVRQDVCKVRAVAVRVGARLQLCDRPRDLRRPCRDRCELVADLSADRLSRRVAL